MVRFGIIFRFGENSFSFYRGIGQETEEIVKIFRFGADTMD